MQFVPECYKTQEMCLKAVDACPFVFESAPNRYNTQETCDKAVSNDLFVLKYCLNIYKTQETCDKSVDDFLQASKFVSGWFITSKMIKKLDGALSTNDDILFPWWRL